MKTIFQFQKNLIPLPIFFTASSFSWTNFFFKDALLMTITFLIVGGSFAVIAYWDIKTTKFRRSVTVGTTVRFEMPQAITAFGTIEKIPEKDTVVIRGIADNKIRIFSIYKIYPV